MRLLAALVAGWWMGWLGLGHQARAQTNANVPLYFDAQVVRLPPVESPAFASPVQYTSPVEDPFGDQAAAPPQAVYEAVSPQPMIGDDPGVLGPMPCYPPDTAAPVDPDMPKDSRPGVFQKINFTATWLARMGADGYGTNDLELNTVWGLPCPTRNWPLVITPGFAVHYLDGPASADLPPRVYDAYTEFRWIPRFCERLRADLAITPGVYSDFEHSSRDAVRVTGYGSGIWTCTPALKIVLGAAYLDRRDVAVLPIGGFIWKPCDDSEFRLVFPQPKIARRVYCGTCYNPDIENWVYVAGELGGGIWAFQRPDLTEDVFSYRDYRLLLGTERKVLHGLTSQLEVGYIFGRKLEFDSTGGRIYPTDTVLVRGALRY